MKKVLFLGLLSLSLWGEGRVLYRMDFSTLPDGDVKQRLASKGFELLLDADKLHPRIDQGRLELSTDGTYAGIVGVRFKKPLENVASVVIDWGVEKFPKGADWEHGNNRLALGALIALGTKKFSSGIPFTKKAPYFLGPFIGQKEKRGKVYLGKLYRQSGRYYCVSNKKGRVRTRFDIEGTFQEAFGKPTPPVVAYGFQMNTKDTIGGAKAFIRSITFYAKPRTTKEKEQ